MGCRKIFAGSLLLPPIWTPHPEKEIGNDNAFGRSADILSEDRDEESNRMDDGCLIDERIELQFPKRSVNLQINGF